MSVERIQISELRVWSSAIFDAAGACRVDTVNMDAQHYWKLDTAEVWSGKPPEPCIGDLLDDVADIRRDVAEPDLVVRGAYAWHTLDHFIGVLTKLSAQLKAVDLPPDDGDVA